MAAVSGDFIPQSHRGYNSYSNGYMTKGPLLNHYGQNGSIQRTPMYLHAGPNVLAHNMGESNMSALTQSYGGMNLTKPTTSAPSEYGRMSIGPAIYYPTTAPVVYPNAVGQASIQNHAGMPHSSNFYSSINSQYSPQSGFPGYGQHVTERAPVTQNWAPRVSSGEMPTLITPGRRDSISSNENDTPGTPYTSAYHGGVTIMDRSPSAVYMHSATPSPSQLALPYTMPMTKPSPPSTIPASLLAILQQEPPIPRAIPAPSSPVKPLDRSLENTKGETNVYIRGLLPETTDDMLQNWGRRFGDIQSSKSIIEHKTGLCKGFGFIKYHNYEDAENCIRGFHHLGYEVSFARESFYAKLKKFSDDGNTNLYVSNLPREMNEHELGAIFSPHKVCSSRILRDNAGIGRGVGFARFENRDICEMIIKNFNNSAVSKAGGEEHVIQIRYADTAEQKMLKHRTAAARQFRTAEYEYGVQARNQVLPTSQRVETATAQSENANEFENFLHRNAGLYDQRHVQPMTKTNSSTAPLTSITNQRNSQSNLIGSVPLASNKVVEVVTDKESKYQINASAISNEKVPTETTTANKENE